MKVKIPLENIIGSCLGVLFTALIGKLIFIPEMSFWEVVKVLVWSLIRL